MINVNKHYTFSVSTLVRSVTRPRSTAGAGRRRGVRPVQPCPARSESHAGGHVLKHPSLAVMTRWLAPVAGATAIVLIAGALAGTGASAAVTAPVAAASAKAGPHTWAYDPVTGKKVTVYQPVSSTPVHPEKLTHPRLDDMGLVTGAHSTRQGMSPSAATPQLPGIDVSAYQGNINW